MTDVLLVYLKRRGKEHERMFGWQASFRIPTFCTARGMTFTIWKDLLAWGRTRVDCQNAALRMIVFELGSARVTWIGDEDGTRVSEPEPDPAPSCPSGGCGG